MKRIAACTAALVSADPQPMPDRWTQFVTDDGWVVDVNTTNEVIDHIDNWPGRRIPGRPGSACVPKHASPEWARR